LKQERPLQATEFQVESALSGSANIGRTRLSQWIESDRLGPTLETIMLGLRWRGYLSDQDRNLIDWLFGEFQIAFILRDGQYLHPDGVPLLPDGALDVPPLQSSEAVFTLRLKGSHRGGEERGLLRAARLSRPDEPELIIGCLGGEDSSNRRPADDRFGHLVTRFRAAWEKSGRIEANLRRRIDEGEPNLIICRTSGRIVAASESMARRLGSTATALAGREYSEIAAQLAGSLNADTLHLENVRIEETFLSLASFRIRPKQPEPRPNAQLADFFVHKMKNKLATIMAASSHLCDLLPQQNELTELLEIITAESTRLDGYLDRLNLLEAAKNPRRYETSIMDSLKTAVSNLTKEIAPAPVVEFRGVRTQRTVSAVPQSLPVLFDAILRTHRVTHKDHGITAIRVTETDTGSEISVFTECSQHAAGLDPDVRWHEYASQLAESMGLTYYRKNHSDSNCLTSMVEITQLQEVARNER